MGVHGYWFIGKVRPLGGQCIKTEFFCLGLPLLPTRSIYAIGRKGLVYLGYPIPMNAHSVTAAYLRLYGWLPALLIFTLNASALGDPHTSWIIRSLGNAALIAYILAFILIGRIWGLRRRQQLVLGKVTALFAWPWILPVQASQLIEQQLAAALLATNLPDDPVKLSNISATALAAPLVFARALYGERLHPNQGWSQVASHHWSIAQQSVTSGAPCITLAPNLTVPQI